MFILLHGTCKDNIRSVILDWKQRSSGRSSEGERSTGLSSEGEGSTGLSSEERDLWVTQANMSCMFSGRRSNTHKGSPSQKKNMCELSLTVFNWNHFEMRLLNLRINFFYLLRPFCPHLGIFVLFCFVSSFTTFRSNFTSGLLRVIYRDLG